MPYIVEKDYVAGTSLTVDAEIGDGLIANIDPNLSVHPNVIYVENLVDGSGLVTLLQIGAARIYDDTLGVAPAGFRLNSEAINILGTGTDANGRHYIWLAAALTGSYKAQLSGNFYQTLAELGLGDRVEFDIRIKSQWCKIAQLKIIQQTAGPMKITIEVWEETPIYEGNRLELHKNVLRRNIELDVAALGGWYGESLVNNLILYKDRTPSTLAMRRGLTPDHDEERQYNLHCALVNELGGTASDFHVLLKIAEVGELI